MTPACETFLEILHEVRATPMVPEAAGPVSKWPPLNIKGFGSFELRKYAAYDEVPATYALAFHGDPEFFTSTAPLRLEGTSRVDTKALLEALQKVKTGVLADGHALLPEVVEFRARRKGERKLLSLGIGPEADPKDVAVYREFCARLTEKLSP